MNETVLRSATRDVHIGPDRPFVVIGERINPTGRRQIRAQLIAGDLSQVRRDALDQVAAGATVLDVNVGVGTGDEAALMARAVTVVQEAVDVPVCIDSSSIDALEAGLAASKGKALVNSVTGEDALLDRILPIVARHGAAVIGIANDQTGISEDPDVRFAVAAKIVRRAAEHGIARDDLLIDPLIMPAAVVPGAGRAALRVVQRVQNELGCNTVCGASNISMGLPRRPQLNAAFLAMLIGSGMRCAITNPLDEQIRWTVLAADTVFGTDEDCLTWLRAQREADRLTAHPSGST